MNTVDQLLRAFIAEWRGAADADPLPYLRRVKGTDRAELAALIDGFLAEETPPPFDAAEFEEFRTSPARAEMVERLLAEEETLADLRRRAGLEKAAVSRSLADWFGFPGRVASVKACYHEIETGQVPPARVRESVWQALSDVLDRTRDSILEAATVAFENRSGSAGAFARAAASGSSDRVAETGVDVESDPVRGAFFSDED